tara:strand:- start:6625 stop:7431 length:807 start_codon:yes stop_codon:yes gene_type:complete
MSVATIGRYERVGETKGPLTIGGARNMIENNSSFVYLPTLKKAGSKADVESWLSEHHPDEAKKLLSSCYSATNLKKATVKKAFERELEEWKRNKEEMTRRRQEERNSNLLVLVELYKIYQEQKKANALQPETSEPRQKRDLRSRVAQARDSGKVLDVSSSRFSTCAFKDKSMKQRLSSNESDLLYHVVYNPRSKNVEDGVRKFMTGYGGFTDDHITDTLSAISSGNPTELESFTVNARPSSPLSRPFSSPVRRRQDNSVDDLLESLDE